MQKKLRLRFLLTSWALLLLFLTALGVGISFYMYQSAVSETEQALRTAVETGTLTDDTRGMITMRLDRNGNIQEVTQSHLSLSDETIQKLSDAIPAQKEQHIGETEVEGVKYRYLGVMRKGGEWVTAAECSQETALMKSLRTNTIIFVLIGMALLMPACLLLTKWVSKPIETAWEKQNDFVSDATHELKTPLTVIATDTEAILSNPEASIGSQQKWLGDIQTETGRMAGLVADLLFLAKIDAGEIHLDAEALELTDLLEEQCMERESDIFESGKIFDYEMTPGLRYFGDWKRIRQMTAALLDNAEMYTPEGGSIKVVLNHDRKQRVRIVISNSGEPISPTDLEKIFDRFYRADPSRARTTGGYGLGLCVAKSIAELHGGTITASSGNGINVFTIILGDISERKQPAKKKK